MEVLSLPIGTNAIEAALVHAADRERLERIEKVYLHSKKDPISAGVGLLDVLAREF